MICPNCGETYKEKYNFCIKCGTKLITKGEWNSQEKIKELEKQANELKLKNFTLESKLEQSKDEIVKYKNISESMVKEHSINLIEKNRKMEEEIGQIKKDNEKLKEEIAKLESQKELNKKDKKELKDKIYNLEGEIIKLKQDNTAKDREIRKLERKSTSQEIKIKEAAKKNNKKNKKVQKTLKTENKSLSSNPRYYGEPGLERPKFNPNPNYFYTKKELKKKQEKTVAKTTPKSVEKKVNTKKQKNDLKLEEINNLKKQVNESKIKGFFKYQLIDDIDSGKIKTEKKLNQEINRIERIFKRTTNRTKPKSNSTKTNPRFYGDAETRKFNRTKRNYYNSRSSRPRKNNNRPKFNALPSYYNKNKSNKSPDPAIYKIVNNRTGEVFVSNSIDIEKGKKRHMSSLRNGTHPNPDIQDDYNKGDTFSFVVLEEFSYYDRKEINQITKEYIKKENSYNYGYNRYSGGGYDPYKNNKHHSTGRRLNGKGSLKK